MKIVTVKLPYEKWEDGIYKWLRDCIGPGVVNDCDAWRHCDIKWSGWIHHNGRTLIYYVEFRDATDAEMFKLAWL